MNGEFTPVYPQPYFGAFTAFTPALPKFYTDVLTMEQGFKELCKQFVKMIAYSDTLAEAINGNTTAITELQEKFVEFVASGFDDYYREQVRTWVSENLEYIFTQVVKQVFFGLTDNGYFCAYVPDSWSDIQFDTGAVYGEETYGRLILRFEVDGN